jgi:hypothetical protein
MMALYQPHHLDAGDPPVGDIATLAKREGARVLDQPIRRTRVERRFAVTRVP